MHFKQLIAASSGNGHTYVCVYARGRQALARRQIFVGISSNFKHMQNLCHKRLRHTHKLKRVDYRPKRANLSVKLQKKNLCIWHDSEKVIFVYFDSSWLHNSNNTHKNVGHAELLES